MSELRYLLESHLDAILDIQALLAREKKSLLQGDDKDIGQLAMEKQCLLDKLAESAQAVGQVVERDATAADPEDLTRCVELAGDADELSSLRDRIGDELRACAELNRINGAVLECNRAASERALRVLLSPQGGTDRYGATGRLENIGSRQSIGSA